MSVKPATTMHADIKKATDKLDAAEAALKRVLSDVQKNCPHNRVIHAKWRSSEWGSPFRARRLCLTCGLEEEARNSGWGDHDGDFPRLKTKGFHKIVSHEEIYQSRFPCAEVNC